jgi:hypothetical protein
MGGFGSGRKFGAECTSDYRSIDIRRWQRDGLLNAGRQFNWQWSCNGKAIANIDVKAEIGLVRLSYSCRKIGDEWESQAYPVMLQTTPCHYGGMRYWFICPAVGCSRRVALLYLGDKIFACRHCYQLAYQSQRETDDDRRIRKADKIRDKLNWEPGILNGNGWKPKGMHWKTFWRLQAEHETHVDQSLIAMGAKLKIKMPW